MPPSFRPLSPGQTAGWYFASAVYGLCIALLFSVEGYLPIQNDGDIEWFIVGVFAFSWIVGVIGMRVYISDKDPTDFRSILGLTKKNRSNDK